MHRILPIILAVAISSGPLSAQTTPPATPATAISSVTLPSDLDRVLRDYERAWRANDIPLLWRCSPKTGSCYGQENSRHEVTLR